MFKKALMSLALLAFLFVSAAPMASAQALENLAEVEAVFKQEAPLSQADIDVYLKIAPKAMAVSQSGVQPSADFFKEFGITDTRGLYITTKISLAQTAIQVGDAAMAQVPEAMKPTKDEIELVKKNQEAITKALTEPAAK